MTIKMERKKKRIFLKSFLYRLIKLPIPVKTKLRLFLNLEWIFERLSLETSWAYFAAEQHPMKTLNRRFLLDCVDSSQSILDLGCKYGHDSFILSEKCKEVVGIDYDTNAIEKAKSTYHRQNLSYLSEEGIKYLTESSKVFDVLILSHVLEHLDDPVKFLQEFKQYFKYIYVEVPDFDRTTLNHFRKSLGMELIYSDDDHISEFDRYDLQKHFQEAGLEVLKSEYYLGNQKHWRAVR